MRDSRNIGAEIALIRKGTVSLETEAELRERLAEGKPLRIKHGVDPSAPDIHLGHTVVLNKLKIFQELGHEIIYIIGDFTARIGDPSGRSKTRPQLSEAEVKRNAETYTQQVFKILDPKKTKVLFNSQWLGKLSFEDIIRLASKLTVAQMLQRDDYATRYSGGVPISLHEFLYPLAQGYDSIHINADLEIGGTDQTFNLLLGRELQRAYGGRPQVIMTMPLLEGLDGVEKMSKSLGNYIGVTEQPFEIFGKIMSISDELMARYYELLTEHDYTVVMKEIPHPRDRKIALACEIVKRFHGEGAAKEARENFRKTFAQKRVPEDDSWVKVLRIKPGAHKLTELIKDCGFAESTSEARRLITQGAVKINSVKILDEKATIEIVSEKGKQNILKVGKKNFARIEIQE